MISPSNPSLQNSRSYVEDKAKILSELKGKDDNKEAKYTRYHRTNTNEFTEIFAACIVPPHIQIRHGSSAENAKQTGSLPLNQEALSFWQPLTMEKLV